MHAAYPAHPTFLDLITPMIPDEEETIRSS